MAVEPAASSASDTHVPGGPQSKECQVAHWKLHKKVCHPLSDGEVWGIKILDNRHAPWSRQFQHVLLKPSHPVFTVGELCPVTDICGTPLLIWSERLHGGKRALDDNQPAVYLRIEPDNGFAPLDWQMDSNGTCIVVRRDRKLLTLEAIEIIYKFHARLINDMNYAEGEPLWDRPLSPEWLREFADEYREEQKRKGRLGFDFFP
ncbi:hypothetical protein ACG7TL_008053 [Trametes sanguinea]